ncbi:MAG: N-acetyltransferase [Gemmatimonadaceae bacterium]|nr:N-acetyltransferase [Gemmatimonadaceae bacterium]
MKPSVQPVTTPHDVRRFIDVPWHIAALTAAPQWAPPLRQTVRDALDVRRNPFYRTASIALWIAERDGRPVGRIAAIENAAHNEFHGDTTGFFGFFECADDPEAATALVDAAADWLGERGLTSIQGPMSPSTNYETGLLVDGFEHPAVFMTPWNPPYYATLLEQAGMSKAKDLLAYQLTFGAAGLQLPDKFAKVADRVRADQRVTFRDIDLNHFERELATCWDIYNAAWERNWGYAPMTRDEFAHMAGELRLLVLPQFAFVAHVGDNPAAFILVVPDYNVVLRRIVNGRLFPTGAFRLLMARNRLRSGRVMALGVKREYRSTGLSALLMHEVIRRANAYGVTVAEASWILEDNALMNRPLVAMGAKEYRRWRIYEKAT